MCCSIKSFLEIRNIWFWAVFPWYLGSVVHHNKHKLLQSSICCSSYYENKSLYFTEMLLHTWLWLISQQLDQKFTQNNNICLFILLYLIILEFYFGIFTVWQEINPLQVIKGSNKSSMHLAMRKNVIKVNVQASK